MICIVSMGVENMDKSRLFPNRWEYLFTYHLCILHDSLSTIVVYHEYRTVRCQSIYIHVNTKKSHGPNTASIYNVQGWSRDLTKRLS